MHNELRYRVERIILAVTAFSGIAVVVADFLGWLEQLPLSTLAKITLLILSTITLLLLLEVERFRMLDSIYSLISQLDIETISQKLRHNRYVGILQVHERFKEEVFTQYIESAKDVDI